MANRQLTPEELQTLFAPILVDVRQRLVAASHGDAELLWALRRKLGKELTYDERGKPMQRKLLKLKKRAEQLNKCAICAGPLPEQNSVLDRIEAMAGYTRENTRLLCPSCDAQVQKNRGYK